MRLKRPDGFFNLYIQAAAVTLAALAVAAACIHHFLVSSRHAQFTLLYRQSLQLSDVNDVSRPLFANSAGCHDSIATSIRLISSKSQLQC